jgi:Tol biopolymer transport system component
MTPLKVPNRSYQTPRLSPDGNRLAVHVDDGGTANIWIYDLSEAYVIRPLTLDARNRFPVWTRDGERVAFSSDREGGVGVWLQRADGTGAAERVTRQSAACCTPLSWHPREQTLLMSKSTAGRLRGPSSLWTYSTADKKASQVAAVESRESISAEFSPDGKWIAYHTFGESSRTTLWVMPYPPTGSPYRIDLGRNPVWSRNGLELLFSKGSDLFVTSLTTSPSFNSGVATRLPLLWTPSVCRNYDITRDGTRVLAVVPAIVERRRLVSSENRSRSQLARRAETASAREVTMGASASMNFRSK